MELYLFHTLGSFGVWASASWQRCLPLGYQCGWLQYTEHVGQASDRNKMYSATEAHNYVSEQELKPYLFEILLTWSYLIVRLRLHVSLLSSASYSVFSRFPASCFQWGCFFLLLND